MSIVAVRRFKDLSLGTKLIGGFGILLLPVVLLGYFLVSEKDDLIDFTDQEIAGVAYLRPAHATLGALIAGNPSALDQAAAGLKTTEAQDSGRLQVTSVSQDLMASIAGAGVRQDPASAIAKTADLISAISDNSNITLDPDMDAYYVGDIVVNQATGLVRQARALAQATAKLRANPADAAAKIAVALALDGVTNSGANLASDLAKALKGNADGRLANELGDKGEAVKGAVDTLFAAAQSKDGPVTDLAGSVIALTQTLTLQADDALERLLRARIAQFHRVVVTRLGLALVAVLMGGALSLSVIRSITKPLGQVTRLMGRLTEGELDLAIPESNRADEIGRLIDALRTFQDVASDRDRTRRAEAARQEEQQQRAVRLAGLNADFDQSVRDALTHLRSAVGQLTDTAEGMARDSDAASTRVTAVATASERASSNVQTVAAAAEQLSASSREIGCRISESNAICHDAAATAKETATIVGSLSDATGRIGEVIGLITEIAGQTNLLALNATIEAARAGDAGKGFAVVASEVKTLASQTARATDEISTRIASIQQSAKSVVAAITQVDAIITQISAISLAISSAVEEQGAATSEIARNVHEAAQGTADVAQNITQIADTICAAENVARALLTAAQSLDHRSAQLEGDVGSYLSNVQAI